MLSNLARAFIAVFLTAAPALAEIGIADSYARSSGPSAKTGAVFMTIVNSGPEPDRLLAANSDIAVRVELHTHKDIGGGVMQMLPVEDGFAIPAGGRHALARGGDHVMLMGLEAPLQEGQTIPVTLIFEKAGEIHADIPVNLQR